MRERVLVVEDEESIASAIALGLTRKGDYEADIAADGAEALRMVGEREYDLVCLDLNLPHVDGMEVCRRLRAADFQGYIIMLTASSTVPDRVNGLEVGADDFLPKPFALSELLARMRALFRRPATLRRGNWDKVRVRGLVLDPNTNSVWREGVDVHLTPREFDILLYLAEREGRAVPQEELIERLWGDNANPFTQTVKVHMNNLRRKLNDGFDKPLITTVRGKGYVL